jgi:hypothetical protein
MPAALYNQKVIKCNDTIAITRASFLKPPHSHTRPYLTQPFAAVNGKTVNAINVDSTGAYGYYNFQATKTVWAAFGIPVSTPVPTVTWSVVS